MNYYAYNINTGWTSGNTVSKPQQLIAGYVNADNEVALDLWVEKSINISASNTNVFQLQIDIDQTSWQNYNVKIYDTLPSYVGHSAPLINDTNGHNWGEYISKPTIEGSHSYYLNIRAQEAKKEFNLNLTSIKDINAAYHITYKWTDSSGIQQEYSQYQNRISADFTPADEGYPTIGYDMDWGDINNYIYNGQFIAKSLPYSVYREYSIQGIFKESDDPFRTENAQYGDIVYFNEPQLYEYEWKEGTPEKSYTQRAEFSHIEMQELDRNDNMLSTSIIANISRFEYICKNTNEATTQIKFIVVYKEPITFTIDYKLPRNSTYNLETTTLPDTTAQTPESVLLGQKVETTVTTNEGAFDLVSTGKWKIKYLSSKRVEATPKWNIKLNLPYDRDKIDAGEENPYIINILDPEEPFYLCPNYKDKRVEYYRIYGTNYSPYFPYTLYDFKLWDATPDDAEYYHFSLNLGDASKEEDDGTVTVIHKTMYLGNNVQPWPYFVYNQYGRPAPILDIMTI